MKKLSHILCLALALAFLTRLSAQAASGKPDIAAAYKAYREILKAAVDERGVIKQKPNSQEFDFDTDKNELVYAELIDFDNDGLPALLYVCSGGGYMSDRECYVYTYSNGQAVLCRDKEIEKGPATAYMGQGADNFHGFEIATDKNGVKYLRVFHIWMAEYAFYYTTGKNGKWVNVFNDNAETELDIVERHKILESPDNAYPETVYDVLARLEEVIAPGI